MEIRLQPPSWATHVVSDLTDWKTAPVPVAQLQPIMLPDAAYFEYAFLDPAGEIRPDPANDVALNPWWTYARGIRGSEYRPTASNLSALPLPIPRPESELQRFAVQSEVLGQRRRFLVYSPAGYETAELPAVYVHDGLAFLTYAHLPAVLDKLVRDGQIPPTRLVFVPPIDREQEYAFNEKYLEFTLAELVPAVDRHTNGTGERMAMGASLGGLVSARLAWTAPEIFSTAIALSGAFITGPNTPKNHRHGSEWMRRQIRENAPKPIRFAMFCGTLEWLIEANRKVAAALNEQGYDVSYFERPSGHNWVSWRDAIGGCFKWALASAERGCCAGHDHSKKPTPTGD